jgi:hypothetical protein
MTMHPAVWPVVGLILTIAGYFVLVRLGRRVLTGKFRAETAAAAIVVAFIIGSEWPYAERDTAALPPSPAAPAAGDAAPGAPREASEVCSSARLVADRGKGNLDGARTQRPAGTGIAAIRLRSSDELVLNGWATEPDSSRTAQSACPVVDGAIVHDVKVTYGALRPDVAAAFGNPGLTASAFEIHIPARRFSVGRHRVQAAAVSADGSARLVDGTATVIGP